MAKHEFGIIEKEPLTTERFDIYEPDKYNCIPIDDDLIEPILAALKMVNCYWHTILNPGNGLAYCGITLIPPESLNKLIEILSSQKSSQYNDLISLTNQAKEDNKYLIHFGI